MKVKSVIMLLCMALAACSDKEIKDKSRACSSETVATSLKGSMMRAKINGKTWEAQCMYRPYEASIIGGEGYGRGSQGVSFSFYDQGKYWEEGFTEDFSESNVITLFYDDEIGIYSGKKGKLTITSMTDEWIEGNFYCTATSGQHPTAKIEITDGYFRIPAKP